MQLSANNERGVYMNADTQASDGMNESLKSLVKLIAEILVEEYLDEKRCDNHYSSSESRVP